MTIQIETIDHLKSHLNIFKYKCKKKGYSNFQYYPAFCLYYDKNRDRFEMPKEKVLYYAVKILVEEE